MKYKIIYNGLLYIEAEADNEEERKEVIKGIMYSIDTFTKNTDGEGNYIPKSKSARKTIQTAQESNVYEVPDKNIQASESLATDGQIRLMNKWKIDYPDGCTKREACNLIHQYKRDHGMEDR